MNAHDIAREFPQRDDIIYLNHAAVAPWPSRTAEAITRFAQENVAQGALAYRNWNDAEARLRDQLRELINAPSSDDIALLKSTSEALSVVAHGLTWRPGDNVVSCRQEFPSNRIVWQSLEGQGVTLRQADLAGMPDPEQTLMALVDPRTRLLAVSSVQYGTGLRLDLERLGAFCKEREVLFCVDAIQSVGALPMDVQSIQADFVMADGHKWMLGPEGLALFYCAAAQREKLRLHQYGWHMVEDHMDYDRTDWQAARTSRRFECGSANMLGIHALSASLSLLLEVGLAYIEREIIERAAYLMDRLVRLPQVDLVTDRRERRHGGIVTFRVPDAQLKPVLRRLAEDGVVCAPRGGGIRYSPHFYTPWEKLEHALKVTGRAVGSL